MSSRGCFCVFFLPWWKRIWGSSIGDLLPGLGPICSYCCTATITTTSTSWSICFSRRRGGWRRGRGDPLVWRGECGGRRGCSNGSGRISSNRRGWRWCGSRRGLRCAIWCCVRVWQGSILNAVLVVTSRGQHITSCRRWLPFSSITGLPIDCRQVTIRPECRLLV